MDFRYSNTVSSLEKSMLFNMLSTRQLNNISSPIIASTCELEFTKHRLLPLRCFVANWLRYMTIASADSDDPVSSTHFMPVNILV